MFNITIFIKSFITGFAMCLAIGPISIIVIRKVIRTNKYRALIPGLGSVTADIFYSTVTGFGLVFIAQFLEKYQQYIQLGAAGVLFILAYKILKTKPKKLNQHGATLTFLENFSLGFFLALFNPITLFLMTTILSALGVHIQTYHLGTSLTIIFGLLFGELTWWLFLTNITSWTKDKFGKKAAHKINTISGVLLFLLALIIVIKGFIL